MWEYNTLKMKKLPKSDEELTAMLNGFGNEGWELVNTLGGIESRPGRPSTFTFIFKRAR